MRVRIEAPYLEDKALLVQMQPYRLQPLRRARQSPWETGKLQRPEQRLAGEVPARGTAELPSEQKFVFQLRTSETDAIKVEIEVYTSLFITILKRKALSWSVEKRKKSNHIEKRALQIFSQCKSFFTET